MSGKDIEKAILDNNITLKNHHSYDYCKKEDVSNGDIGLMRMRKYSEIIENIRNYVKANGFTSNGYETFKSPNPITDLLEILEVDYEI